MPASICGRHYNIILYVSSGLICPTLRLNQMRSRWTMVGMNRAIASPYIPRNAHPTKIYLLMLVRFEKINLLR